MFPDSVRADFQRNLPALEIYRIPTAAGKEERSSAPKAKFALPGKPSIMIS